MAKQYFIKNSNGDWDSLNGKEFYDFIISEDGRNRWFIDFDEYMLEVTKYEYTSWRKEKDHSDYINENLKGYKVMSFYDDAISKHGTGEDVIRDEQEDIDSILFKKFRTNALQMALRELDDDEYEIIYALYLADSKSNQTDLAKKIHLTQSRISKKNKEILKKLKKLVIKFEKSSQWKVRG